MSREYLVVLCSRIEKRRKELMAEFYYREAGRYYDFESYIIQDMELNRLHIMADKEARLCITLL